jgi:hypothetical protein
MASLSARLGLDNGKPIWYAETNNNVLERTQMTTDTLTELNAMTERNGQPTIALYNQNERLVGVVSGWRVADGVMKLDESIRRAIATDELTMPELVEIDQQISRLRKMRGTL